MSEEVNKEDVVVHEQKTLGQKVKTKKRLIWPWVLAVCVIIFIVPLFVLAFAGFVPGLSSILGANKPKDLGIRWSTADYASYQQKTGGKFLDFTNAPNNPQNLTKKIVFDDPKQMDVNITSEEITATINSIGWLWMPIKNSQIKFGNDTVEISGNINAKYISNFISFIGGVGYSSDDIDRATNWAKIFGDPPIYIKAKTSATNNKVTLEITEAKVGRFGVPTDIANRIILTGTNNAIVRTNGLKIESADSNDGRLHFVGSSPTTVYIKRN